MLNIPKFNRAFIQIDQFTEVDAVINGKFPLHPLFIASLNQLIQAIILHEVIFSDSTRGRLKIIDMKTGKTTLTTDFPLLNTMVDKGIVKDIAYSYSNSELQDEYLKAWEKRIFWYGFFENLDVLNFFLLKFSDWIQNPSDEEKTHLLDKHFGSYLISRSGKPSLRQHQEFADALLKVCQHAGLQVYLSPITSPYLMNSLKKSSLPIEIFSRLLKEYRTKVTSIEKYFGFNSISIPPLLALLLDRCKDRSQIPEAIINLRKEFTPYRKIITKFEQALSGAENIGEQFDLIDDMENSWEIIINKIKNPEHRIIHKAWEILKEVKPTKIITKTIDMLKDNHLKEKAILQLNGLPDTWKLLKELPDFVKIKSNFEKMFGTIEPENFKIFYRFIESVESISLRRNQ